MKNIYIIIVFTLLSATAFAQNKPVNNSKQSEEIVFLTTNDIHGNIGNFARMAFVVDSIKKIYDNVFILNAGDLFSGNPIVDMYPEKGFPMIDIMNKIGYTVSAIGNHEFDYGQEVLKKRMSEAKFPFICANIISKSGIISTPDAFYKLKTKNNLNITILSVIDNSANGKPETHPTRIVGLEFPDPIPTALKYKYLASKSDLLVALTHIGLENDVELAKQMPEINLIVGGHSHTIIDSLMMVNGVLITQTGGKLRYLGEIKLVLQNGKITDKSYKLIDLKAQGGINQDIKKLADSYSKNPMLNQVLAKAKTKLTGNEELGCFYTDALREMNHFDIVFQNSGGIRIHEIPEGDITVETIYKMDPFGNYLMGLDMTTDEIRSLIKASFKDGGSNLRVSGIHYTIFKENNSVKEIQLTDYNEKPIDENRKYFVGMNDYILNTFQFVHSDKGKSQGVTTAEVIMEYLKKVGEINYSGEKRSFLKDLDNKN